MARTGTTYDQANRLTVATVDGSAETYACDGDGTRFSRQVGTNPAIRYVAENRTPPLPTPPDLRLAQAERQLWAAQTTTPFVS